MTTRKLRVRAACNLRPTRTTLNWPFPKFDWTRAWSLVVKLSGQDMYPRGGSTGSLDTTFHALAWGSADGHRLSAPVVELDHFQNNL